MAPSAGGLGSPPLLSPKSTTFHRQPSLSPSSTKPNSPHDGTGGNRKVEDRPSPSARKASEIDMPDGVVDMEAFSQLLALDDGDATKEFSKALVWAFCDQAETTVEEMEHFLVKDNIESVANKAHYLKGGSASLGLMKVSRTCQSIYHTHFIPHLSHFRYYSYQSDYSAPPSLASVPAHSFSSSSTTSSSSSSNSSMPSTPPAVEVGEIDFEAQKVEKAKVLIEQLKQEIREATDWLYAYYKGSDAYEASK